MVKNRLVYAKSINEVAENNRAGVSICKVMGGTRFDLRVTKFVK